MKVFVLLADKGKVNPPPVGTVDLLNAGWSSTIAVRETPVGPVLPPQAVAIFYEVDFPRCNRDLALEISLVNEDGVMVQVPGPVGLQPMRIQHTVRVPTPPGQPNGSPGTGSALLEFNPGPSLQPGAYKWQVTLDGQHNEAWCARFYVMPPPSSPVFGGAPEPPAAP